MNDESSQYSTASHSIGQASAAVAMANDAIDNARRAAASSRSRRSVDTSHGNNNNNNNNNNSYDAPKPLPSTTPRTPRSDPIPGTAEFVRNDATNGGGGDAAHSMASKIARNNAAASGNPGGNNTDLDLKNNDNAYHVVATLLTDRLLPKLHANPGATHYTLTQGDVDFFTSMLPSSVRRSFVEALRYRLQLIKSSGGGGACSAESVLGRLTMQCQLLGLDRMGSGNVLLDLGQSAGMSYPINFKNQGPLAFGSGDEFQQQQQQQQNQDIYGMDHMQQHYNTTTAGTNGVTFGLTSPMAMTPNNANSPPSSPIFQGFDPNVLAGAGNGIGSLLSINQSHSNASNWETTAESLARQQIMAEINETKFLMKGSVTPEAVTFWKRHLEELSQRLVILSLEEQMHRVQANGGGMNNGNNGSFGGGNTTNGGYYDGNANNNGGGDTNDMMYNKVKGHYDAPNIPSQEEYLENNRRMREEAGMNGGAAGGFDNPNNNNAMGSMAYVPPDHHILDAKVDLVYPTGAGVHAEPVLKSALRNGKHQQEELPVCDVVAPSDLPGGYMFEAQLGTKKFLATVPPGGVTKGQRFVSTMLELETIEIPVPLGAWRDETHECFNDGICHPLFLNTLLFPCIALGQIMTRAGLDWQGEPANKLVSSVSCANMMVILAFWVAMNASVLFMFRVKWERGYIIGLEFYVPIFLFNLFMLFYMMNLTRNVRGSIRNKYQIPEDRCLGCEDCMCATFCMPCTICQMGRHTADFDTYRGTCCTKSGLPRQVVLAPVTFYEDQYENADQIDVV